MKIQNQNFRFCLQFKINYLHNNIELELPYFMQDGHRYIMLEYLEIGQTIISLKNELTESDDQ